MPTRYCKSEMGKGLPGPPLEAAAGAAAPRRWRLACTWHQAPFVDLKSSRLGMRTSSAAQRSAHDAVCLRPAAASQESECAAAAGAGLILWKEQRTRPHLLVSGRGAAGNHTQLLRRQLWSAHAHAAAPQAAVLFLAPLVPLP
jgi:hypothetical protein